MRESDVLDHTQVTITVHVHKKPVNFSGQTQQIRLSGDPVTRQPLRGSDLRSHGNCVRLCCCFCLPVVDEHLSGSEVCEDP